MSFFGSLGDLIGRKVVDDMVADGRMERIVKNAMAAEFEKMAGEPRYAKARADLLGRAKRIRETLR